MRNRQRLLTDEQWELIEPLFPKPRRRQDNRGRPWASNPRPTMGIQSSVFGRHSVDSADRGDMAIPACRISLALDMLASAETVGRTGRMVARLESVAGSPGCRRATAMGRSLPGWELRSRQKGGAAVGKTKRGKGT